MLSFCGSVVEAFVEERPQKVLLILGMLVVAHDRTQGVRLQRYAVQLGSMAVPEMNTRAQLHNTARSDFTPLGPDFTPSPHDAFLSPSQDSLLAQRGRSWFTLYVKRRLNDDLLEGGSIEGRTAGWLGQALLLLT